MKTIITIILTLILIDFFGQTGNYESVKTLYDQGKNREAIDLASNELEKLKNSDSTYEKILKLRVDCYMNEYNFKSAIMDYQLLTRLQPKSTDNYSGLAYAYWASDDAENSMKAIKKAYEINPNDPLTLSNSSYYYGQAGKIPESIEFANKGLALNNLDSTIKSLLLNNRAFGYLSQSKYDIAFKDTNESIALNPSNSFAYCYRGLAHIGLKHRDLACRDFETSKKLGGETLTNDLIKKYCGQ